MTAFNTVAAAAEGALIMAIGADCAAVALGAASRLASGSTVRAGSPGLICDDGVGCESGTTARVFGVPDAAARNFVASRVDSAAGSVARGARFPEGTPAGAAVDPARPVSDVLFDASLAPGAGADFAGEDDVPDEDDPPVEPLGSAPATPGEAPTMRAPPMPAATIHPPTRYEITFPMTCNVAFSNLLENNSA